MFFRSPVFITIVAASSLTLILAGCGNPPINQQSAPSVDKQQATQTQQSSPQSPPQKSSNDQEKQEPKEDLPNIELTKGLLFQLLVAEMAGYRGELDIAINSYLQAAVQTRDPRMAERAVRIALYANDMNAARVAAKLWVEVAPENIDARLMLGLMYLRSGDEKSTIAAFTQVIENHAVGKGKAISIVGAHLLREKDKQASLQIMQQLAVSYPGLIELQYVISKLAEQTGDLSIAQQSIEKALAVEANVVELNIQYARLLTLQGKTQQALEFMQSAIDRQPEEKIQRLTYARMLLEERLFKGAREQFEFLLSKSPDNEDILYALGILGIQMDELETAEKHFLALSAKDKRRDEAYYYLGQITERRKDFNAAINLLRQIQPGSFYLEAQLRIASLMVNTTGLEKALEFLRTVNYEDDKERVRLLLAEGEMLREAGAYQQAMTHFDKSLLVVPGDTDLLYARALIAEKIDRIDILMRDLQSILDIKPDHAHALNALGYTLADRTARYNEALKYIQRALELKPNDAAIVDSMGWVQYRLGNFDSSISYLRRALQLNKDAEIAAHLGEVLLAKGDKVGAYEAIRIGLEVSPDNKQLLELLKQTQP